MPDKVTGFFVALPVMVGCCLAIPWLVGWVMGVGFTAWIADNAFAVIAVALVPVVAYLVHRGARSGDICAHGMDGRSPTPPETNPSRDRQCGSR